MNHDTIWGGWQIILYKFIMLPTLGLQRLFSVHFNGKNLFSCFKKSVDDLDLCCHLYLHRPFCKFNTALILSLYSHAVGMAVAQPLGFKIDFVRNPISGSAAYIFIIILKFIFTAIFEIKVQVKKFLRYKKFYFRSPIFMYQYIIKYS